MELFTTTTSHTVGKSKNALIILSLPMKYQITKKIRFEAAHRLIKNYQGKCTNNHGHSWQIILHLQSPELDEKDMLIDFNEIDKLKIWIDEQLDHATILWEEDPFVKYLLSEGHRVFVTKKNPTSEHIAEIILFKAQQMFESKTITVVGIEVNETCTSAAKILL